MAGVRKALIVATDDYSDPKLTRLNAPAEDARILAGVLRDQDVGCFDVQTVLNQPSHDVALAIATFFGAGKYGDTLLAHFSCHGVKSPSGELYLATTDTDLSDEFKLKVTAVPSALVRDAMEESRAGLILCFVDCCYSGAFVKLAKAADTVDLTERLGGKGRAVITASTSLQLALDGDEEPSLFTHAVIDGLRTGAADRDLDGLVSLDELYSFVHEQVTSRNPNQTPVKSFDVQGEVYVARRSTPVTTPAPLDPELLADARSSVTYQRSGAVNGLAAVLAEGHPGRSYAARLELSRMASGDDSFSVRAEAQQVLDAAGDMEAPPIPEYEPPVNTRGARLADPINKKPIDQQPIDQDPRPAQGGDGQVRWWHLPWFKRSAAVAGGLLAVLLIGGYAVHALRNDTSKSSSGADTGPTLSDSQLLVSDDDPRLGSGIFALDAEAANPNRSLSKVIDDPTAKLPTISEDRQWMVYLEKQPGGAGTPRLARIDGTDDARLLSPTTTKTCPFTTRPAFSPDGRSLAVVCTDASGRSIRMVIVDRDGNLVRQFKSDTTIQEAPTWTGDGQIVYTRGVEGDQNTTLWAVPADGSGKPEQITDGRDGSDSHPDWSDQGLLFLRTNGATTKIVYMKSLDERGVNPIWSGTNIGSPTWVAGDQPAVVWMEPAQSGAGVTLWGMALGDKTPTKGETGAFGPPAWGSR
jgi:hypothetical protein